MEKDFYVPYGYIGFAPWLNRYQLFATEEDYRDFIS